jgi:ABC-type multidrug transport system ATPase subunit
MKVSGATKTYGDLVALAPLDLTVAPGERVALVGHNGSGKSTLLRLAAGLLQLTDGSIEIAGEPAGSSPARAAVSFLPDDPVLYDDLSVREHLAYVAALHGVDAEPKTFDDLLERLGLLPRADDLPARFSRGLRQKTSIALGLVRPYRLLLVDEPFVGLDAPGRQALLGLFDEAHGDGAALVVATHDPNYVERVDRCVALRDGVMIHDGPATPDEVLELVGS